MLIGIRKIEHPSVIIESDLYLGHMERTLMEWVRIIMLPLLTYL